MTKSRASAKSDLQLHANVDVYLFPADFTYQDYLFHKEHGTLEQVALQYEKGHNLATNAGLDLFADLILGTDDNSDGNPLSHIEVGSGSTAADAGDTGCTTPVGSRHAITYSYSFSTGEAHADTFFLSTENNGTIRETSIHNASSSGDCAAHFVFGSNFTKSEQNTMTIAWTITLTAVADA